MSPRTERHSRAWHWSARAPPCCSPPTFTPVPGALIVGNFGDGMIHAYDPATGRLIAEFTDSDGKPLAIDGLWALAFGPKKTAEDLSENLYFTAGPAEETHGVFGVLTAQ